MNLDRSILILRSWMYLPHDYVQLVTTKNSNFMFFLKGFMMCVN